MRRFSATTGSRRQLLRFALVPALAAVVLSLAVVPVSASTVPETLTRSAPVGVGAVEPGFPVDFVGVLWAGEHGDALVRFRHDGRWGSWRVMGEDGVEEEGQFASALVRGDDAEAYQVRVPPGVARARSVAINTTDGSRKVVAREPAAGAHADHQTGIVSRAEWGADESLRFDSDGNEIWPKTFWPVQKLTVHHTATDNDDPDPEATVRAIYRYHAVDRGWGDIGYQFLVDEAGHVYEGRHTDDDPVTPAAYRVTGDGAYLGVAAAHVGGWNSGNLGFALLGTLTDRRPTAGAQRALEQVLAVSAGRSDIDPTGSGPYVNPVNGDTWEGQNIPGHRDFSSTECPGGVAYELLPTLRDGVAGRVGGTLIEDTTAPVIANLVARAGSSTAKITWTTTSDPSDSQVEFWPKRKTSITRTPLNLSFVEEHVVDLSGLRRRTTYEYRVISADVAGNRSVSAVGTFTT